MFRRLLVSVLVLVASTAGAQRVLTTPDLSALTQNGAAKLAVDAGTGWIYASRFSSRALGVPFAGLARVSPSGVPDVNWRPIGLTSTYSHVVGTNGDVYVLGQQDSVALQLVRYSATRSGEPVIRYSLPPFASPAGTVNRDMRVDEIFGGRDHWLYLSVYDANEARRGQRIVRIDTRTDRFDPQWIYDITGSNQGSPLLGPDGAIYVVGVTNGTQQPMTWTITRVDQGNLATIRWTSKFAAGTLTATGDASGRLYVMTRAVSNVAAPTTVTRLTAAGVIDSAWNSAGASAAMSQSVLNTRMRSQGGDLFVTATPNVPARIGGVVIVRFDESGVERARWTKAGVSAADQPNVFVDSFGGDLYANTSGDLLCSTRSP